MKKLILSILLVSAFAFQLQASILGAPKWQFNHTVDGIVKIDVAVTGGSALITKNTNGSVMTMLVFDNNNVCQSVALFNSNANAVQGFDAFESTIAGNLTWQAISGNGITGRVATVDGVYTYCVDGIQYNKGIPYAYRIYASPAGITLGQKLVAMIGQF